MSYLLISVLLFVAACGPQGGFRALDSVTTTQNYAAEVPKITKMGSFDVVVGSLKAQGLKVSLDPQTNKVSVQGSLSLSPYEGGAAITEDISLSGSVFNYEAYLYPLNNAASPSGVLTRAKLTCVYADCSTFFVDLYSKYNGRLYQVQVEGKLPVSNKKQKAEATVESTPVQPQSAQAPQSESQKPSVIRPHMPKSVEAPARPEPNPVQPQAAPVQPVAPVAPEVPVVTKAQPVVNNVPAPSTKTNTPAVKAAPVTPAVTTSPATSTAAPAAPTAPVTNLPTTKSLMVVNSQNPPLVVAPKASVSSSVMAPKRPLVLAPGAPWPVAQKKIEQTVKPQPQQEPVSQQVVPEDNRPTSLTAPEADRDDESDENDHDDDLDDDLPGYYMGNHAKDLEVLFPEDLPAKQAPKKNPPVTSPQKPADPKKPQAPSKSDDRATPPVTSQPPVVSQPDPQTQTPSAPVTSLAAYLPKSLEIGKPIGGTGSRAGAGALQNSLDFFAFETSHPGTGYNILYPKNFDHFGATVALDALLAMGQYSLKVLQGYVLQVSSVSKKKGGPSGHAGHQNGVDMDIAYYFSDPNLRHSMALAYQNGHVNNSFMVNEQWKMFKYAVKTKPVHTIFVHAQLRKALCVAAIKAGDLRQGDDSGVAYETMVRIRPRASDHHNHFHMRMQCPVYPEGVTNRCRQQTQPTEDSRIKSSECF